MTERGHGVVDVAKRLGMSDKSLYLWVRLAKEQLGVGSGPRIPAWRASPECLLSSNQSEPTDFRFGSRADVH